MTDATTSGTASSPTAPSPTLREEVSDDASRLAETAKQRIDQAADGQKQAAVGVAQSTSSALDRAVDALRKDDGAPDWLTSAFESTARQIESFAGSIEGKNIDDLRRNVSQFARQSPMAFLAASAAAGFAAARFLRAGSEYKSHHPAGAAQGGGQQSAIHPAATGTSPTYRATTSPEFTS